MSELFGISMNVIMLVLLAVFAACLVTLAVVYFSNRIMFRMGLRNVGRRRAQSSLVIAGLMLATVIITAAFSTGDTTAYSVTSLAYDNLQRTDLSLHHFREEDADPTAEGLDEQQYIPETVTPAIEGIFAGDENIEGFMPFLFQMVPVFNPGTRLAEPLVFFSGFDQQRLDRFGGLTLTSGERADLAGLGEDEVLLGEQLADDIEAGVGDVVQVYADGKPVDLRVAGIVRDERSSGQLEFGPVQPPNMAAKMATVQRIVGREGLINSISVVLYGDVRSSLERTAPAAARLEAFASDENLKEQAGLGGLTFQVERNKEDVVKDAEELGSLFVTMFVLMGLFSIAAGAMLIFTLFVMLAAERRTEMGIARAVGAQRINLIQSFLAEGVVYDLLAGLVGVVLGVAAALGLVLFGVRLMGEEMEFIRPHIEPRSLVVSFCLGAVLTFITVAISSYRVSHLNIVAAVRGQSDSGGTVQGRTRRHWSLVVLGAPFLALFAPLGLYLVFRKGLGMAWARVLTPATAVFGVLMLVTGFSAKQAFPWTLGVSLLIFFGALLALNRGAKPRIVWNATGIALALYWLNPFDLENAIMGEVGENIEMFVFSGIMIVTAFTLIIVWNARLLTGALAPRARMRYRPAAILAAVATGAVALALAMGNRVSGLGELFYLVAAVTALLAIVAAVAARYPRFAPALKMGVAYPLASRFRTGMTIAMFSLVVFSITVMSVVNASVLAMFTSDEGTGGWDIQAMTNPNNPIDDLAAALKAEGSFDPSVIAAGGRITQFDDNSQEARGNAADSWEPFPILAGDDAFFRAAEMKLEGRAAGYADDRAVYEAVRTTPDLAVVDSSVTQTPQMGNMGVSVDVDIKNGQFDPFEMELRDPVSGRVKNVTIVGILSGAIPSNIMLGVYMNETTYREIYGAPDYRTWYLRLTTGTDSGQAAKGIKAALVTQGVEATSIEEMIDDMLVTSRGFMRILQAFMGLGLFVGIAALGVIALRSVVERRQQIGMLRAIGYQKGTVALTFIFESGFIALMGILSGVIGATILSWNLVTSGEFSSTSDIEFYVPWLEIAVYSTVSFAIALLMTWWPSHRASSVAIAEALRYE